MRFQKLPISCPDSSSQELVSSATAKSLAICSNSEARTKLEYEQATTLCVLPLGFTGQGSKRILQVAVAKGTVSSVASELKFATNHQVKCIEIERPTLTKAIQIAYRADDAWLENGLNSLGQIAVNKIVISEDDILINDSSTPVPRALRTLLEYAIAKEASDIHLVPTREGMTVKLRVNGELLSHSQPICAVEIGARLISRIKVLASLKIDERALPQDGSFSLSLKSGARQFRVSTLPTIHGEKCVMRITSESTARPLSSLGFSADTLQVIKSVMEVRSGLLLLTGSTGSGKTTTLYSITQALLAQNLSIASVEDPVETHIEGISQTTLAPEKGLDYPNALRSILRQDPDVILVGEIRDAESAKLVISAALTGHLVLSTVHGSSVVESITRLLQLGVEQDVLLQVCRLIIKQSLIRRLCSKCKVMDLNASQSYGGKIFKAVGCASCDYSGFDGRLLISERMHFCDTEVTRKFMNSEKGERDKLEGYEDSTYYIKEYLQAGLIILG